MNALEQQIWDENRGFAERRRQEYLAEQEERELERKEEFFADGGILPQTYFAEDGIYSVEVDMDGVTVYSECCGDTMSRETAIALRDAINIWLERTEEN